MQAKSSLSPLSFILSKREGNKTMKKSLAYTFLFWLLIADLASAGDYKIVFGWTFEVCQAYLKNLNSFPDEPPMVCERKLNPQLADFTKPQWQPLDAMKHLDLVKQIDRTMFRVTAEEFARNLEKWTALFTEHIKKGRIRLSIIQLDLDQDGSADTVLRYDYGECDHTNQTTFAHPSGRRFFVVNGEMTHIDEKKTQWLPLAGRPDMFLFKGQTFIDAWAGNLGFKDGQITVYTPVPLPGRAPCTLKYQDSSSRRTR